MYGTIHLSEVIILKKFLSFILSVVLIFCCGCYETNLTENNLYVYFIDVGQADCVLITLNGKSMLIDGGNIDDGPSVIKFIKKLGIDTLDVVVGTHSHEDHIGGLAAIIDSFNVGTVYSPVDTYHSTCFAEFKDAADRQNGLTICTAGMAWNIDNADVSVLWPYNTEDLTTNNTSIVLKVSYGKISFLFTGDLEKAKETSLIESDADLSADILKVGHHGSETSTSYYFLRTVMPSVGIISCGKDNSYGHPHEEPLERLKQAEVSVFRTDELGTISLYTDGNTFTVSYNGFEELFQNSTATPAITDTYYIGNKKSKKFHFSDCSGLPKKENQISFRKRGDATDAGYTPCGICNP